tara:strand:- start:873 stop:1103 length:231 start_codon:yes stop_codon:yes gene_type:complete
MDLQTKKLHIIESILSIGNEKVIEKLEAVLKKEQQKEDNKRVSIEQYNRELDEADAEIDKGEFYTQEEVEKMSRKW